MKTAILLSVLWGILVLTLSCSDFDLEKWENVNRNNIEKRIVYFQDARTGICFAFIKILTGQTDSQTMTCVPCENIPPELLGKE